MGADWIERLQLGKRPRVIGTIITADYLRAWAANKEELSCDLVELRVDGFSEFDGWIEIGREIEASGKPVIATVRHGAEGGKWRGDERARLQLLNSALEHLSGVDIELAAAIAEQVATAARSAAKCCILSFHDFAKTPPKVELEKMIVRMHELGAVAKVAATANSEADVLTLRSLLHFSSKGPVCVIGMGSHGRETRLTFPREGSCFTYGYLDTPGAPGQFSARELREHFAAEAKS